MARPAHLFIDTAALRHNLVQVKRCAPNAKIMAVVKANAYGHGSVLVAKTLESQVDGFAVSCLEEAIILREAGIKIPILLLEGFFDVQELSQIVYYKCDIVLHNDEQLQQLKHASLTQAIKVWLKINTGMHRLGISPTEFKEFWQELCINSNVKQPPCLITHFACADEINRSETFEQLKLFQRTTASYAQLTESSLANSAAILQWADTHYEWVRPGIMLYGISPLKDCYGNQHNLQAVMTLNSRLISVRHYPAGAYVGYGATYRCPEAMPVGVVAMGYGDGYPRHVPNGTPVLVNQQRVDLIGRVSMDMLTVDLRQQPNAKIGDPVELWGKNLAVEEIAECAGTLAYELLCNVNERVRRTIL